MTVRKVLDVAGLGAAVGAVALCGWWVATGTDPLGVRGALRGVWEGIQLWVAHLDPVVAVALAVVAVVCVFAMRDRG